jgi:hypothetical protein
MESHGYPKLKGTAPRSGSSRPTRSSISISIIAEVRTAEGKLYILIPIDRTSKFAFVELRETV